MKLARMSMLTFAFFAAFSASALAQNTQMHVLHGTAVQPGLQLSELVVSQAREEQ